MKTTLPGNPRPLWHCESLAHLAISNTRQSESPSTMSQILNLSHHTSDEDARYLTSLLIYHLVER